MMSAGAVKDEIPASAESTTEAQHVLSIRVELY